MPEQKSAFRTTDATAETKHYRLLPGKTHRQDGRDYGAGDAVALTASQFAAFKDKFEPSPVAAPAPSGPAPAPTSGIAQDVGAKTKPGEPVAGVKDEPGAATSAADRELKRGR
jgi:hypothetical protein